MTDAEALVVEEARAFVKTPIGEFLAAERLAAAVEALEAEGFNG